MATDRFDQPRSFVVHILRTNSGETRCRVTDVATRESWIVERAEELITHLVTKSHRSSDR